MLISTLIHREVQDISHLGETIQRDSCIVESIWGDVNNVVHTMAIGMEDHTAAAAYPKSPISERIKKHNIHAN